MKIVYVLYTKFLCLNDDDGPSSLCYCLYNIQSYIYTHHLDAYQELLLWAKIEGGSRARR